MKSVSDPVCCCDAITKIGVPFKPRSRLSTAWYLQTLRAKWFGFWGVASFTALTLILMVPVAGRSQVVSLGVVGDAGFSDEAATPVRDSMRARGVFQLMLPGDNLYALDAGYGSVWDAWKKLGFAFRVVALGNHTASYAQEISYFQMAGEYYSISWGGARFLVLNSDNPSNLKEQFGFLVSEIKKVQEGLIFLVYHHPSFDLTPHHHWTEKFDFQVRMRAFLRSYGHRIAGVFVGHDHIAALYAADEIPVIVSGAAVETHPAYKLDQKQEGFRVRSLWTYDRTPHWVKLDWDVTTQRAWVNFIQAKKNKTQISVRIWPR